LIVSAWALSYQSPTLPTDGSSPASANLSVYFIDIYIGRIQTVVIFLDVTFLGDARQFLFQCRISDAGSSGATAFELAFSGTT